jgi:hypothetical protein
MTKEKVNEILKPYGLKLSSPQGWYYPNTDDGGHGYVCKEGWRGVHAFSISTGISEEKLEEMALAWSLENSFG